MKIENVSATKNGLGKSKCFLHTMESAERAKFKKDFDPGKD